MKDHKILHRKGPSALNLRGCDGKNLRLCQALPLIIPIRCLQECSRRPVYGRTLGNVPWHQADFCGVSLLTVNTLNLVPKIPCLFDVRAGHVLCGLVFAFAQTCCLAAMDPLTAFGLACNILNVVDAAVKCGKTIAELYDSSSGYTHEMEDLQKALSDLEAIEHDLKSSQSQIPATESGERMQHAAADCARIAHRINEILVSCGAQRPSSWGLCD